MMQRLMDVDVAAIVASAVHAERVLVVASAGGGGGGKRKRRSIQISNGVPFPRLNFPISSANAVEDKSCNCSVNEKFNCDNLEVNQPSKMLNLRSRRSQERN
uniref:Uncharacterized protein n=1 Tax=Meloidogyne enterolobii TaxID=390850 RepID=A0A6V7XJK5_MELEN|nr:unnamed protein product [Meloidogyne enterolobii]